MKNTLAILLLLTLGTTLTSQAYITALGARLGDDFGISLQQRISKRVTLEGIYQGGIISNNYEASIIAEQHLPLFFKTINFYVGAGFGSQWIAIPEKVDEYNQQYIMPMAFVLEMTLGKLSISADFMPQYILDKASEKRFEKSSAISLRYVIIKNNKKRKKAKKKKKKAKEKAKKKAEKEKAKEKKGKSKLGQFFDNVKSKFSKD